MSPAANWGHTLPEGTRIDEFEIISTIGEGGFGIVYLAYDHSLQRRIALKEYMPSSLAVRTRGASTVEVKSEDQLETFQVGLRSFVNEARLLAQFDHPALVKVHRFWEANGTAYMVMPFYEGPTLRAALAKLGHPPDERWLRRLLNPLLDALSVLHAAHCFHRDVAPDNILLTSAGPLLLDFGAARRMIGAANQNLTVILKPGYAPIEQYGEVTSLGQGPWTDIYALACVMYCAITGKVPMASIERFIADRLEPASTLAAGRYDANFLKAIDAGLAVKPEDRPQNIAQFRAMLSAAEASPGKAGQIEIGRTLPRAEPGVLANPIESETRVVTHKVAERTDLAAQATVAKRSRALGIWLGLAAVVAMTAIAVPRLINARQAALQTAASPRLAVSPVASTRIALKTVATDSPVASLPVNLPARLDPAPTPDLPKESSPLPVNNPSVATIQTEASQDTADAHESQRALTQGAGESLKASGVDMSAEQEQRCGDVLRKASLEPLSPEETDFLRRDCR